VAGIGFLGAGSIIKGDAEEDTKGLTTAAGMWLTLAIGIAAGIGWHTIAVLWWNSNSEQQGTWPRKRVHISTSN